jgi:hypothetical protein
MFSEKSQKNSNGSPEIIAVWNELGSVQHPVAYFNL